MKASFAEKFMTPGVLFMETRHKTFDRQPDQTSVSCYRVVERKDDGVLVEHGFQGLTLYALRWMPNGHRSFLTWNQLEEYSKIGVNTTGLAFTS